MIVKGSQKLVVNKNGSIVHDHLPLSFYNVKRSFFLHNRNAVWLSGQSPLSLSGRSKFQCIPGQLKMVPPLGPLLAQFLSGLAAEFILFLNNLKEVFPESLSFGDQAFGLYALKVIILKFRSEELRVRLSFSALQTLFQLSSVNTVIALWQTGFGCLFNFKGLSSSVADVTESFRLIFKNMLQLESYLFLLVNLYLTLCSWFVFGLSLDKKFLDFLVFDKKNFSSKAFFCKVGLQGHCYSDKTHFFELFLLVYRAVSFIVRGFSLQLRGTFC